MFLKQPAMDTAPLTPKVAGQRALAAILFSDAVEFSARANEDEQATLALIEKDFEIMRESCARHGGEVLKSTGDGLLMIFRSAIRAVECAIDMQQRLSQRVGQDLLQHRMGVHLGDVVLTDVDVLGDGVNIAARLQSEASPNGICLSQAVYDVIKGKLSANPIAHGMIQLKNIAEPVGVYEIVPGMNSEKPTLRKRKKNAPNTAMAWALAFVGLCILVAAGAFWFKQFVAPPPPPGLMGGPPPGMGRPRGALRPGDPGYGPVPGSLGYKPGETVAQPAGAQGTGEAPATRPEGPPEGYGGYPPPPPPGHAGHRGGPPPMGPRGQ